ncbi:MAG: hypothetical protein NTX05_01725, partial [Fusobacteria bacterium]|nr:hypothetical protein [Fusobacteriota bacterium]
SQITMYTGSLMLPWGLKPLWSWLIDVTKTKRWWIYTMEILMALSYIGVVFTVQATHNHVDGSAMFFFKSSIAVFWAMAFFSSSHDIAVDGFYLVSLSNAQQSYFVGMQRLFYQLAKFFVTAFILILVGKESETYGMAHAWTIALIITGIVTLLIGIYHAFFLPKKEVKVDTPNELKNIAKEWPILLAIILLLLYKFLPFPKLMIIIGFSLLVWRIIRITLNNKKAKLSCEEKKSGVFAEFFQLEGIWVCILFIFTFRLGENFVSKVVTLFLLDPRSAGGLGLTTTYIGYSYTFVLIAILLAGSLGGLYIYKNGIKKVLWIMYALVNVPHLIYIYMAYAQPHNMAVIILCQMIENFAVTFALAAFTMVLFYTVRNSRFKTSHFAFLSAINIVALMLPSMYSGPLQMAMGYKHFFLFVQIMMLPSLAVLPLIKIDPEFGKSTKKDKSIWILLSVIIIATILVIIINQVILK